MVSRLGVLTRPLLLLRGIRLLLEVSAFSLVKLSWTESKLRGNLKFLSQGALLLFTFSLKTQPPFYIVFVHNYGLSAAGLECTRQAVISYAAAIRKESATPGWGCLVGDLNFVVQDGLRWQHTEKGAYCIAAIRG